MSIHCSHTVNMAKTTVHVNFSLKSFIIPLSKMHFLVSWCFVISGFYCCVSAGWPYTAWRVMVEYKGNDTGWKSRTEVQRVGGDRSMNRSIEVLCTGFMGHPVAKGIREGEGLLCHSILLYITQSQVSLNKLVSWKISNYRTLLQ